jgi:hypothetical protein
MALSTLIDSKNGERNNVKKRRGKWRFFCDIFPLQHSKLVVSICNSSANNKTFLENIYIDLSCLLLMFVVKSEFYSLLLFLPKYIWRTNDEMRAKRE